MNRLDALVRLGVATGHVLTVEERALYLERLTPYSDAAISAGCRSLETTSTFWPKLSEVVQAVSRAEPTTRDDDPRTWRKCPDCLDTGWRFFECSGRGQCGRSPEKTTYTHEGKYTYLWGQCAAPHRYVTRCPH